MILAARVSCLFAFSTLISNAIDRAETVISLPKRGYSVGYKVVQQIDRAREFKRQTDPYTGEAVEAERARPIQTLIWYPASGIGTPLRYADYLATRSTETNFYLTPVQLKTLSAKREAVLTRRLGSAAKILLDSTMVASGNAPMAASKFPVVIYAPGAGGTADENADLFE